MKLKVSVEEAMKVIEEIVTEDFIVNALSSANMIPMTIDINIETHGRRKIEEHIDLDTTINIPLEGKLVNATSKQKTKFIPMDLNSENKNTSFSLAS